MQQILSAQMGAVESLAFLPDGKVLFISYSDQRLRLWLLSNGSQLKTLTLSGLAHNVVFSPDGRLLAMASENGMVELWGVAP